MQCGQRNNRPDEHRVLIDSQLERTDRRHLGQLLTCAAGPKAWSIVWVARELAEDHREAIDCSKKITTEQFDCFAPEIELWRSGTSASAPMFNVIAQPREWVRDVRQASDGVASNRKMQQQAYWQALRGGSSKQE